MRVKNFGCRLNSYESQVIQDHLNQVNDQDVIVFNTCAVTAEAERQARQEIRKIHKQDPQKKILVTGCAAQVNPDQFVSMPEVFHVIGNQEKLVLETYQKLLGRDGDYSAQAIIETTSETPQDQNTLKASSKTHHQDLVRDRQGFKSPVSSEKVWMTDIMDVQESASHLVSGFEGKARAFIQIQNGCDHRCTFCIIPYGRGNSRSVPLGQIVQQIQLLQEKGYKEFVLTGVDITAYGQDLPGKPTLGQMVKRLLALAPTLMRLRLSSLDPAEIDEDLWQLIRAEPRLLSHFHISLQAGNDMILKRMKRRHTRQDIIHFAHTVKKYRPEAILGADIIAGFPTETDEQFLETKNIIQDAQLTLLHVFGFSPREGTPAARMPQLPGDVIKKRAAILRKEGEWALENVLSHLQGTQQRGLIESITKEGAATGKTDCFLPFALPKTPDLKEGEEITFQVTGHNASSLIGQLLDKIFDKADS